MHQAAAQLPATTADKTPAEQRDKPKRLEIPPKTKAVIRLMIEQGMTPIEAAKAAHYSTKRMWLQLERPHVQAYLKAQRMVFRAAMASANDFHLTDIRGQRSNMSAAVQAVRALERMSEHDEERPATNERPGLVIVVQMALPQTADLGLDASKPMKVLEHEPIKR